MSFTKLGIAILVLLAISVLLRGCTPLSTAADTTSASTDLPYGVTRFNDCQAHVTCWLYSRYKLQSAEGSGISCVPWDLLSASGSTIIPDAIHIECDQ